MPWPPCSGAVRYLGFASTQQARHNGRPNRVHLRYGLIVHLRLLSTPPRGDAVTFGYGVPEHSGGDFHPAGSMQLQAHWITPQRRKVEWAWCVKQLLDEHYPEAERLVLVCDNLNTHTGGTLYEAFPAAEARRLWERLEVHYTPKHGSRLNMAETELSVLSGQCLDQRIDEVAVLRSEVGLWEEYRNRTEAKVRWRFTTEAARIKLEKLYPVLEYPDRH